LATLGTRLRALYEPVTEESLPDRLERLLHRLDEERA